jgi:hypothetical protein
LILLGPVQWNAALFGVCFDGLFVDLPTASVAKLVSLELFRPNHADDGVMTGSKPVFDIEQTFTE